MPTKIKFLLIKKLDNYILHFFIIAISLSDIFAWSIFIILSHLAFMLMSSPAEADEIIVKAKAKANDSVVIFFIIIILSMIMLIFIGIDCL